MPNEEPDIQADINKDTDRGETTGLMEPMLVGESSAKRTELADLALELASKSAGFRRSLPPQIGASLADLVRSMNCYYSNLIEGHDTHPIDIERALNEDYSKDAKKRDLQLEARAHIDVQRWIDEGGLAGRALTIDGVRETHRRFCELLPDEMLWVEHPGTREKIRVIPGELREHHVEVGRHVAISSGAVPRFLVRFEEACAKLGKTDSIIAAATAHHRLLWIHPFIDGNGRVARLMSHAVLLEKLDTGALWSVARGLARSSAEYKAHLAACDEPRRGDRDGRGTLSEVALAQFVAFFLKTCIDQISFMEELIQPERLRVRVGLWAEEEIRLGTLPPKAKDVLEAILYHGELPRSRLAEIVGTGERQARRIVSSLTDFGVVKSESSRAPLQLAFPATLASRWMPGLVTPCGGRVCLLLRRRGAGAGVGGGGGGVGLSHGKHGRHGRAARAAAAPQVSSHGRAAIRGTHAERGVTPTPEGRPTLAGHLRERGGPGVFRRRLVSEDVARTRLQARTGMWFGGLVRCHRICRLRAGAAPDETLVIANGSNLRRWRKATRPRSGASRMRRVEFVVAVAVLFAASSTTAAITTISLKGVALSGSDDGHLSAAAPFGTLQLGVDLSTGQTFGAVIDRPFTLEFRIDDTLGDVSRPPGLLEIEGFGADSPVQALFSMNGYEYAFGNEAGGLRKYLEINDALNGYANESRVRISRSGDFTAVEGSLSFLVQSTSDLFSEARFTEDARWVRGPRDIGTGSLYLSLQDSFDTPKGLRLGPVRTARLDLRFDAFVISSTDLPPIVVGPPSTAVPEPATWALLIGGFAAAGASLRSRRRRNASNSLPAT
eukprot:gene36044-46836_t